MPDSVDNYSLLDDRTVQQAVQRVRDTLATNPQYGSVYAHAKVGLYVSGADGRRLVFLAFSASNSSALEPLLSGAKSSQVVADAMTSAKVTDPRGFDAGPLGGTLRRGVTTQRQAVCAWADGSTTGLLTT